MVILVDNGSILFDTDQFLLLKRICEIQQSSAIGSKPMLYLGLAHASRYRALRGRLSHKLVVSCAWKALGWSDRICVRGKLSERVEGQVKPLIPTPLGGENGQSASICYPLSRSVGVNLWVTSTNPPSRFLIEKKEHRGDEFGSYSSAFETRTTLELGPEACPLHGDNMYVQGWIIIFKRCRVLPKVHRLDWISGHLYPSTPSRLDTQS